MSHSDKAFDVFEHVLQYAAGLKPRKAEGSKWRIDTNGIVIVDSHLLKTFVFLNPVAARAFLLCDGQRTLSDILQVLADTWPDVDRSLLIREMLRMINALRYMQVLVV